MTVLQAIRAKCLDCTGGDPGEVKDCPCQDCSLYPFRMGKNPNRAGIGNSSNFLKNAHSTGENEEKE